MFVPENLESSDMDLILLHEKAHYRRADNLKRLFALLLCTIHWFNPIVWRCFNRFTEDLEIETDRLVIQWIGQENKAKYFDQVIRYNQASFVFVGPAFSVNPTVRRIQTQFEERPGWVVTSGLFLMMILVSVLVFLANS